MREELFELALIAPGRVAERLAEALEMAAHPVALSVSLFDTGDGSRHLSAHFSDPRGRKQIERLLEQNGWSGAYTFSALPEEDWVARSEARLSPVRAGRFLFHGRHDRERASGRWAIEIDAGRAFGTAHHETTRACLLMLDSIAKRVRPQRILDLGSGSGVLAIAAARVFKTQVVASDNDPVAVAVARGNAAANGERLRIMFVTADGLAHPALRNSAPFALVFANILLTPLMTLAPSLSRKIAPGGYLVLSGITKNQVQRLESRYRACRLIQSGRLILGDWAALLMRRG